MQFLTIAPLLFAAAFAAPAPQASDAPAKYENIDITEYYLRKNNGIQGVGFTLKGETGEDVACSIGKVDSLPSEVVACGESPYRFGLIAPANGTTDASLAIYHQTSQFYGRWGTGSVPTYCRAGGNGPDDFVCNQVAFVTIGIQYP